MVRLLKFACCSLITKTSPFAGDGLLITGGGYITTGISPDGGANKAIALKNCTHVTFQDFSMKRTGHFALLATGVSYLTLQRLVLRPDRDGVDLVGVQHVWAEDLDISGGHDDAFVLKSDYSLGSRIDVHNVTCRDSSISTDSTTALEIGSESVGDFYDIHFSNISISASGDAGIGIVTMDGGLVHDISYHNISMRNVTSPFQFYIGARLLRPSSSCTGRCTPGRIFNILARGIHAHDMYR
jgi:polygalacturonase